jgi:two-component system sensor histidine kinase BarA
MTNKGLFHRSIHLRFLAVALLPLLLITFALNFYIIDIRNKELTKSLNTTGEMASDYLATISDFALYSQNLPLLKTISQSVVRLGDVNGVAYLDPSYNLILSSEDYSALALPDFTYGQEVRQQGDFLYFKKPIYLSGIEFTDYQEENLDLVPNNELIGWVIVVIDRSSLQEQRQEIITTSLWLAAIGLAIATILTYLLSLRLIKPIHRLTGTIKQMASGNLEVRAISGTHDELNILANGINQLAKSVLEGKLTLEDRVRVATRQLHETLGDLKRKNLELDTARMEAETANQAKSDFLARMSHELRTPITSIQGFVRLLNTAGLPDSDRHYCQIIDQAAFHLLTLIDDILAFSKLQSNTVELAVQPFDLAECTEQVVALFAPQTQHKGLDLVIDYAPELKLQRVGDAIRIQQILSNLIANSIKFCDEGGVYLTLKTNEQQAVIFQVRDTGIGILDEAQDQLFNAFSQADTSISRIYGGTGLGLSIVKSLVELMDGQINLKSSYGQGACFEITLPLPLASPQPDSKLEQRRVVIADCHPAATKAVVHALQRFGIENVQVTNTDDLIRTIEQLGSNDQVILCPPTVPSGDIDIPSLAIKVRASTPAKLILVATQLNLYQQFNARQRAGLNPIIFLPSPPPLSELRRALMKGSSDNTCTTLSTPDTHLLDGVNILIAEDNQFTRLLLDTLLSKLGAYCTLTSNGIEALAACQQDQFDLFLVDIHMPKKNGIETIEALRKSNNHNTNIPAIAVTADILQQEEQALFNVGANGLLIKPLDEQELLRTICEQLNLPTPQESMENTMASNDISINVFRQEVQTLLKDTQKHLHSGHTSELRENIHQLLGIAGVFKLKVLESKVKQLHELVKTNELDGVAELINDIHDEIKNTDF